MERRGKAFLHILLTGLFVAQVAYGSVEPPTPKALKIDFAALGLSAIFASYTPQTGMESYEIRVDNGVKAMQGILGRLFSPLAASVAKEFKLGDDLKGYRFMMQIDWQKFASGAKSIFIYPSPNSFATNNGLFGYMALNKKGLHLSFNPNDDSLIGTLDEINIEDNGETKDFARWSGASFECRNSTNSAIAQRSCLVKGGNFEVGAIGGNSPGALKIEDFQCSYSINALGLGVQRCRLPRLSLIFMEDGKKTEIRLKNLTLLAKADLKADNRVNTQWSVGLEHLSIIDETSKPLNIELEGITLQSRWDKLTLESWNYLNNQIKISNKHYPLKNLKKLFNKDIGYSLSLGARHIHVATKDIDQSYVFDLDQMHLNDQWILAKQLSSLEDGGFNYLQFKKVSDQNLSIKLNDLHYESGIEYIYNPFPELLSHIESKNGLDDKSAQELLNKMIDNGIGVFIYPFSLGVSSISRQGRKIIKISGMKFQLSAHLPASKYPLAKKALLMAILGKVELYSELRMRYRDFQRLLPILPPKLASMAKALVIHKGDEAIFDISLKNMKLKINKRTIR